MFFFFKQKTAYEMLRSLVGSEMCIRDSNKRLETWTNLLQEIVQRFQKYQVPLIKMFKDTPKEAVCQVFEKVNTGGVSLTVFELLTATFAADDYKLRDDWCQRNNRLKEYKVLQSVKSDDFLQVISILASWKRRRNAMKEGVEGERLPAITCKRKDIPVSYTHLTLQTNYSV